MRGKYIRFVVWDQDKKNKLVGIFSPSYTLRDFGNLELYEQQRFDELLSWFEENLPLPKKADIPEEAVFWFKEDSNVMPKKLWELINILKENFYYSRVITSNKIGYIIYEDDFQVAAVPFKDTF